MEHRIVQAKELQKEDRIYVPEKGIYWVCKRTKNCVQLRDRFGWFWIRDLNQKVCKIVEVKPNSSQH